MDWIDNLFIFFFKLIKCKYIIGAQLIEGTFVLCNKINFEILRLSWDLGWGRFVRKCKKKKIGVLRNSRGKKWGPRWKQFNTTGIEHVLCMLDGRLMSTSDPHRKTLGSIWFFMDRSFLYYVSSIILYSVM